MCPRSGSGFLRESCLHVIIMISKTEHGVFYLSQWMALILPSFLSIGIVPVLCGQRKEEVWGQPRLCGETLSPKQNREANQTFRVILSFPLNLHVKSAFAFLVSADFLHFLLLLVSYSLCSQDWSFDPDPFLPSIKCWDDSLVATHALSVSCLSVLTACL